ncbi:MAG: hypothetical protein ACP5D7_20355 [Limnospira sp.]
MLSSIGGSAESDPVQKGCDRVPDTRDLIAGRGGRKIFRHAKQIESHIKRDWCERMEVEIQR